MAPLALFFFSWLTGFTGAATPGPVSTYCLTEGARRGFWAGARITLGHTIVEFALVILLAFGLGPFLADAHIKAAIALFGGAFLLWMGMDLTRGAWSGKLTLDLEARAEPTGITRLGPVPAGALISLGNPYWFIWWATAGAGFVASALVYGLVGLFAFYFGHILADLTWNSLLTLIASSGRKILPAAFYRWLLIGFGIFLVAFSGYFLWSGIQFIVG